MEHLTDVSSVHPFPSPRAREADTIIIPVLQLGKASHREAEQEPWVLAPRPRANLIRPSAKHRGEPCRDLQKEAGVEVG